MKKVMLISAFLFLVFQSGVFAQMNNPDNPGIGKGWGRGGRKGGVASLKEKNPEEYARIIAEYDKDGDGKLTGDELKAFRKGSRERRKARIQARADKLKEKNPEKYAELVAKYDKDKNGQISGAEFKNFRNDRKENRGLRGQKILNKLKEKNPEKYAELLSKFDTDKDGKLAGQELKSLAKDRRQNRKNQGQKGNTLLNRLKERNPEKYAEVMSKFDTDKDGTITGDERKAMRADRKKEMEKRGQKRLAKLKEKNPDLYAKILSEFDTDKDGQLTGDELKKFITTRRPGRRNRQKGSGRSGFNRGSDNGLKKGWYKNGKAAE